MIQDVSKEKIIEVLQFFDTTLRNTKEWVNWDEHANHKYAISYEGVLYPVKEIVSRATGTPKNKFYGGYEANSYLERREFSIVKLHDKLSQEEPDSIQQALEIILANYGEAKRETLNYLSPVCIAIEQVKKGIQQSDMLKKYPNIEVEWSVGKGTWANIPWLAMLDKNKTSMKKGIYFVILFCKDMSGFYCTYNQGITNPVAQLGKKEGHLFLAKNAEILREELDSLKERGYSLDSDIDLKSDSGIGSNYNISTIAHKFYAAGSVPEDSDILKDIDVVLHAYQSQPAMNTENNIKEPIEIIEELKQCEYNTILYGPPGTGKTYSVIDRCLEIMDSTQYELLIDNPSKRNEAMAEFKRLVNNGRVAFCTFHQSYGYEEFVEGLRSGANGGFIPTPGIFRQICDSAVASTTELVTGYNFDENKIDFCKMSLGNTLDGEEDIYEYCLDNNVIALGWGSDIDYKGCSDKQLVEQRYKAKYNNNNETFNITAIDRFKNQFKIGDMVFISHGNHNLKAIARITGEYFYDPNTSIGYNHFRSVEWLYISKDAMIPVKQILKDKVFSQQTIYMHNKVDINFENLRSYISDIKEQLPKKFILIIDEINRGNISKIFGELITLIEPDKRLGARNEITVTLPYSGDTFGVPQNLYILGTMNTADRSIALLDTALRRRFCFKELLTDYSLLSDDIDGIDVRQMLRTLNERIEFLYDRDHMIGHAYFIGAKTIYDLIEVMKYKVIPLLQEYFYEDWEKIELIFDGAAIEEDDSYFLVKEELNSDKIFGKAFGREEQKKVRFRVIENPSVKAFQRIYGDVSNG
ncbi:DUF3578 domain-containing protein [Pelosinus sp. IPA-1]|uniref:MrcB family domain-containing protein n=1 Tax=Pelosinus sp. IPA-1 TaxID=3029569 RepID=UPI0024361774|nr:DUF3578 domain-containing protein [Pelosinus sp. IPA-1]GMA98822.1 hypothetical protein PIPA1_16220 [Pelosinus sp. IPA-1]